MIEKFLSGRFLLTIITGIVFAKLAWTGTIEAKDVLGIVIMVFTLYFTRGDRNDKGGGNGMAGGSAAA